MRRVEKPVLLILIFLSYYEDFFGNWLLNIGLVAPSRREPEQLPDPLRGTMVLAKLKVVRDAGASNRH